MKKNQDQQLSEFMNQEYKKSLDFWNDWLGQEETNTEEFDANTAWAEIGSKALADATASLASQKNVLDYGCGSGWASVILVKSGCPQVTAVDVAPNGIKASIDYARLFGVEDKIKFQAISTSWLGEHSPNYYDGFFCSNVLDVVPAVISNSILQSAANVCKKGAKVIIGLNPYFDKDMMERSKLEEHEERHLFCDGVLRLLNRTDKEWEELFQPYFKVVECRHFRWDGEADTVNRRIFILENK